MARTALVTGARGFTGGRLCDRLVEAGWDVVATDLRPTDRGTYYTETDNAPHPVYGQSATESADRPFVPADLTDPATLDPLFDGREYDVVFHVASLFDYFAAADVLQAVNVEGARNIATRAAEAGVDHFVGISTLGVLEEADFDEPNDEDAPYGPHNRYCESKRTQEETLREVAADGSLPLTILRPAPIYGPGNRYGVYHIPLVLAKMGFAPVFRIYPRAKQLQFPSVHVDDLCRMLVFVHEHRPATVGEVYNAVGDCIRQDELVDFLARAVDVPRIRIPIPSTGYRAASAYARWHARRIQRIARARDTRPKIDAPITEYLSSNMWFSNAKIRDLGFEFEYRDPRRGLWDFVTWCKAEGHLP
jgi:nucleoside-diphosphate-sugar epimerase